MAEKVDRLTRVNELIKRELATYLEKFPLATAENMLVSITEVNTSGKNDRRGSVFKELNAKRMDMQRVLARNLAFKHTPVLAFKPDRRLELGDRVLAMLNDPAEKSDNE